jgi:hypothetical protein
MITEELTTTSRNFVNNNLLDTEDCITERMCTNAHSCKLNYGVDAYIPPIPVSSSIESETHYYSESVILNCYDFILNNLTRHTAHMMIHIIQKSSERNKHSLNSGIPLFSKEDSFIPEVHTALFKRQT